MGVLCQLCETSTIFLISCQQVKLVGDRRIAPKCAATLVRLSSIYSYEEILYHPSLNLLMKNDVDHGQCPSHVTGAHHMLRVPISYRHLPLNEGNGGRTLSGDGLITRTVSESTGVYCAQPQLDGLIALTRSTKQHSANLPSTASMIPLGISEASTFDSSCKIASQAAPLLFEILGFSLFVHFFYS